MTYLSSSSAHVHSPTIRVSVVVRMFVRRPDCFMDYDKSQTRLAIYKFVCNVHKHWAMELNNVEMKREKEWGDFKCVTSPLCE